MTTVMASPAVYSALPTVYSYTRFSTQEQRKGTGQQRQSDAADAWCEANALKLTTNYADLGVSAFKGKNAAEGELGRFLDCVRSGKVRPGSILLVESLDRLSRDKINKAAELFLGIINSGVTVVTLCDGYRYTPDRFDFAQLVMSLAIFMRANDESVMKSQRKAGSWRIKRAKAKAEATPLGGNTPRWIKVTNGKYVVVEDEAKRVRDILTDYVAGSGIYLLSKKYDIPKATIAYWLTNPVVLGTVTVTEDGKKYDLPNHYPPIIPMPLWRAAQQRKAERFIKRKASGRTGFVNLFSGILEDPNGKRYDVTRHYGFSSYVSPGSVLQARPLEMAVCLDKLGERFVTVRYEEDAEPNPKVGQIDKKIAEIKDALTNDGTLAADLLPILKTLRLQREEEAASGSVVREKVDFTLIETVLADDGDTAGRLRLREIIRDSVERVQVTKVQKAGYAMMVDGRIDTSDGEKIGFRYAYSSRRIGYVMCDGGTLRFAYTDPPYMAGAKPMGQTDKIVLDAKTLTPEVIKSVESLPLRRQPKPKTSQT